MLKSQEQLRDIQTYFNASCLNKTKCSIGLNNLGIPATDAKIRGACLNVIDQSKYKIIYTLFTILNPVCLMIFMFFADRIMGFQKRYIKEYEFQSIELRFYSLMVSNLPNTYLRQKTLENRTNVTQQEYENTLKT